MTREDAERLTQRAVDQGRVRQLHRWGHLVELRVLPQYGYVLWVDGVPFAGHTASTALREGIRWALNR